MSAEGLVRTNRPGLPVPGRLAVLNGWSVAIVGRRGPGQRTVGTQASFLQLFGDHAKVDTLEEAVCRRLGFDDCYPVTGQTYPRKVDQTLLATLAGVAASASKMAHDMGFSLFHLLCGP